MEGDGFLQALTEAPVDLLRGTQLVYPTRGIEEYRVPLASDAPGHLNLVLHADRSVALAGLLLENVELKRRVSEWLKFLIGVEIDVEKSGPGHLRLRVMGRQTPFAGEGSGANQLPFTLLPIALTPPEGTVLMAEPEAHLHPKAQFALGELLIRIGKEERKQIFVETHSEHMLHPFLVAVRKGVLEAKQVAIYEFSNEEGVAKAMRAPIEADGRVRGGLKGFFQQALDELSALLSSGNE